MIKLPYKWILLIIDYLIKKYNMIWYINTTPMLYLIYMKSDLKISDLTDSEFKRIELYTWELFIPLFPVTDEFIIKFLNEKVC